MDEPVALNPSNRTQIAPVVRPLISYAVLNWFLLVNNLALTCIISLIGVFTNIANIIVFYKIGFSENSNVNFFALSVFDSLVSLLTVVSKMLYSDFIGYKMLMLSQVTSLVQIAIMCGSAMITTLISTERCLYVVFPLRVKTVLTRRRSLYLTLTVVAYSVFLMVLLFSGATPPYSIYPKRLSFYLFYFYTTPLTTCFFAVVLATIFLVIRLKKKQRWRIDRIAHARIGKTSDKENKLVKTIIAISTLFIVCTSPYVGVFFVEAVDPRLRYSDPFLGTLFFVIHTFCSLFQAVSSAFNIFFYFTMSSRFNKVFSALFCPRQKAGH